MKAYIEHAAYNVKDMDWYLRFFEEVFELVPYRERTTDGLREVWLNGGIQLCESADLQTEDGRCSHLCLLVDGMEEIRQKALALGAEPLTKHHWLQLPDGLKLEMFEAAEGAIETFQSTQKRKAKS